MSESEETCDYELVVEEWKSAENDECYVDEKWACPHKPVPGEDLCIFHKPIGAKAHTDVSDALLDALETESESGDTPRGDRATEFVGARFERVDIAAGTVVEDQIRLDHAHIEDEFVAEGVHFEGGMTARGVTFGADDRGTRMSPSDRDGQMPLADFVGDDHHGEFPPDDSGSERHVSFCHAEFGGRVAFDGTDFGGIRHVSFAHAAVGGDGDVSFVETNFTNPGHVAFNKADFENGGDVSFEGAIFEGGDVSFAVTDFGNDGDVWFEEITFREFGTATFHDSDFFNPAGVSFAVTLVNDLPSDRRDEHALDFEGATFTEDVELEIIATDDQTVSFSGADFSRASLDIESLPAVDFESANLTRVDLSGVDLSEANLERALLNQANLFDTILAGARLEGTVFGDAQVNEATFENIEPDSSTGGGGHGMDGMLSRMMLGPNGDDAYRCVYDPAYPHDPPAIDWDDKRAGRGDDRVNDDPEVRAGGVYRQFERLAADNALPEWQRRFFVLRQDMQTRQKTGFDRQFALLQRTLFGYGESFGRVVGWAGSIILAFSVLYLTGGWIAAVESGGELGHRIAWTQLPGNPAVLWESLYYSTLTFTALGFGDFRPVTAVGQLLTVLETASGALLVALLVFVLGRRAAQ